LSDQPLPSDPEQCLRGLRNLAENLFYRHLVQEAMELAQQQLREVMEDSGENIPVHFKAIGFVNGLQRFADILNEQITLYNEKARAQREEAPNITQPGG